MSWQATAWAEKRVTGSPARKVLLLVLANYANDLGYCWPSQATLAAGTEQSPDTIQRQLKRLAADGHITIEKRPRASGRWPALAYRLNMAEPSTEPQIAARLGPAVTQCDATTANKSDPGSVRHGHAATSTATEPQALRHEPSREYIKNEKLPSSSSSSTVPREAKRSADEVSKRERPEIVHDRVARKLGRTDVAAGWLIFGLLSDSAREFLASCERRGALSEAIIEQHRAHAHSEMRRAHSS
jgi:hypothetical protein